MSVITKKTHDDTNKLDTNFETIAPMDINSFSIFQKKDMS